MPHYDLVVIGSGPAGEKGAAQAGYFHKKVAVVERQSILGGAGANTGTLPSKTLRETSLYLSGFRQRGLLRRGHAAARRRPASASCSSASARWPHEEQVRVGAEPPARTAPTCTRASGASLDPHTVAGAARPAAEDRGSPPTSILIATGSTPVPPAAVPLRAPAVYDSDSILRCHEVPALAGGRRRRGHRLRVRLHLRRARHPGDAGGGADAAAVVPRTSRCPRGCKARMEALGVQFRMPATVESVRRRGGAG